jgi:D-alanine-D-alanine ligase
VRVVSAKTKPIAPLTRARIGVLMGGQSSERDVSLRTGHAVHQALLRRGYDAVAIDVDESIDVQLREQKIEIAFVALHGPGGEDGTIQGLLETRGLPYTGSGVRASAIAIHKDVTKTMLIAAGIPVPQGAVIRKDARSQKLPRGLAWPVVVKPASEGSTVGITIVRRSSEWADAVRRAHEHDDDAVVETYIPGREITVAILSGQVLPVIEIVAPGGFYDYAAKYQKGHTQYLCPAPVPAAVTTRLKALALDTYRAIGCEGAARVDFRVTPRGKPFVLEINTTPGMTETSLLPMAAAQAGVDYDALTERILESAIHRASTMKRVIR